MRHLAWAAPFAGLVLAGFGGGQLVMLSTGSRMSTADLVMLSTGSRMSTADLVVAAVALMISDAFVVLVAIANIGFRDLLTRLLREPVQPSRDDARIPRQSTR